MNPILTIIKKYDLWVVSLILTSILTLSHIRMYGHDTNGWILPARSWFVDMLRKGDIPFWFSVVKYGFPTTIVQFVGTFWSPYALMHAFFGDYTARTLAVEFLFWRIIALLGMYWLARSHFVLKHDAIVTSAIFIGSGTFASQDVQLGVYSGMAMAPWIIGGIDRCISGRTNRTRFLGSGAIGISGAVVLWSSYPGIWLLFPVLTAPYVLLRATLSPNQHSPLKGLRFLLLGSCLAIVSFAPVIIETINFSVFGDKYRNPIPFNVGALNIWGLTGFLFANPSYINPISAMPTYVGIIPAFSVLLYVLQIFRVSIIKFLWLVRPAWYPLIFSTIVYSFINSEVVYIATLVLCIVSYRISSLYSVNFRKTDIVYMAVIGWVVFWSTSGPMQNTLRSVLPPFSVVRWHNLQLYLADIFLILLSWSIIKRLNMAGGIKKILNSPRAYIEVIMVILVSVFIAIKAVSHISSQINVAADRFGSIPLVWTFFCLALTLLFAGYYISLKKYNRINYRNSRFEVIASFSVSVTLGATLCALLYNGNPPKWWDTLLELPSGTSVSIDLLHLFLILIIGFGISRIKKRKVYISLVALLCVLDTSIASARYLGESEMMNVGGNRSGPIVVDTGVSSNLRSDANSGGIVSLASMSPHMWAYPGTLPMVAAADRNWGEPSVFRKFAVFPYNWRYTNANEITIDKADFRNSDNDGCLSDQETPDVNIKTFHSSEIDLSVVGGCDRLLVWTDTWAKGWSVELDGQQTNVYRINGALRGVGIRKGAIRVVWRYRPDNYFMSYSLLSLGLAVSLGAVYYGVGSSSDRKKLSS